jgi:hypothetical protein
MLKGALMRVLLLYCCRRDRDRDHEQDRQRGREYNRDRERAAAAAGDADGRPRKRGLSPPAGTSSPVQHERGGKQSKEAGVQPGSPR